MMHATAASASWPAAQRALARCIGWARSIGVNEVRLGVTLADSPAHRLYIRHGFLPVGAPEPLRDGVNLLAQNMSLCVADV
jgi:GNAT superfamily N-acetyltransferase